MEMDEKEESGALFNPEMFVAERPELTTFTFGDISVCVECMGNEFQHTFLLGQVVWPGAELLGHYLVANRQLCEGKTIIELGSGVGLLGILAAKFCKRIVLTDYQDKVLKLIHKNLEANNVTNATVSKLAWEDDISAFLQQHGPFDLIIGSDIVYNQENVRTLLLTVRDILCYSHSGSHPTDRIFLLANNHHRYARNSSTFEAAMDELGLCREDIPLNFLDSCFKGTEQAKRDLKEAFLCVIRMRRQVA